MTVYDFQNLLAEDLAKRLKNAPNDSDYALGRNVGVMFAYQATIKLLKEHWEEFEK